MSALRVVAALWLVGYHLAITHVLDDVALPATLRAALGNGSAMSGMFIMLSGFMMYFAYTDGEGRLRTTATDLWVGRVARLWPIMMLGHLMATPFAFVGQERYGIAEAIGRGILATTALQGWVPGWAISFNGPAWTLSVLAFCYAMLPRVVRTLRTRTTAQLVAILVATWAAMLLPTALYFSSLPTGLGAASDAPETLAEMTLHALPLLRFPDFLAGAVIARIFTRRGARADTRLAVAGAIAAVAAFAFLAAPRVLAERFVANGLLSPLFWLVILGAASAPHWADRVATRLRLDMLGEASLSVFLLHMPTVLVLAHLRRTGVATGPMLTMMLPPVIVAMFAGSWLLELHFVRPVAARVKSAWAARRAAPPAAAPARVTPLHVATVRGRGEPPTGPIPVRRRSAA